MNIWNMPAFHPFEVDKLSSK